MANRDSSRTLVFASERSNIYTRRYYDPIEAKDVTVVFKQFMTNDQEVFKEILLHRAASERVPQGIVGFKGELYLDGHPGFLMEACKRENLLSMAFTSLTQFTETELLSLLKNMLDIVGNLHLHRIAHLNISAANWLLTTTELIKLTDFGSAELIPLDSDLQDTLPTMTETHFMRDVSRIGFTLYQVVMRFDGNSLPARWEEGLIARCAECGYSQELAGLVNALISARRPIASFQSEVEAALLQGSA